MKTLKKLTTFLLLNILFLSFTSLSLKAEESKSYRWELEESEKREKNFKNLKKFVENELYNIEKWMKKMNFSKSKISNDFEYRKVGKIVIVDHYKKAKTINDSKREDNKLTKKEIDMIKDTAASYGPLSAIMSIDKTAFSKRNMKLQFNKHTLAHELFHAVHFGTNELSAKSAPKWISEGLAEAVGYAWINNPNADDRDSKYDSSLFAPKTLYERGHFFSKLGQDLDGSVKYAGQIIKNVPSNNGIDWLDNYLKTTHYKSLAKYFPKFIKKHTNFHFYKEKDYPSIEISIPSNPEKSIKNYPVLSIASTFDVANIKFEPIGWGNKKDNERIYLISVDIPKAERIEDLSLIAFKKIKKATKRHIKVFFAQAGSLKKLFPISVPNIATKASNSKTQKFTLRLKATPLSFDFPTCITVGTESTFKLNGDISLKEFFSLKNVTLKANGKIIKSERYRAPKTAQKVKMTLTLPTINGEQKTIKVGTLNVQNESCGILMTIAKSNMKIIWDAKRQVTDVSMGRGVKLLMTDVFMYARSNNGTWIQMLIDEKLPVVTDLGFGAIKMNSFRNVKDMSMISPKDFVARFSWENALKEAKKSTMRCIEKTPKYCTANETRWDYDSSNRLIKASNHEVDMNFKYGSYSATPIPLNAKFITSPMNFEFTGLSNMKPKEVQDMLKNIIPELGDKQSIRKMLDAL